MHAEILKPVIILMIWTMVMWFWLYATRIPAINRLGPAAMEGISAGTTTLDGLLPASVQRKAHNYNHLHEAPTLFYAVALLLGFWRLSARAMV